MSDILDRLAAYAYRQLVKLWDKADPPLQEPCPGSAGGPGAADCGAPLPVSPPMEGPVQSPSRRASARQSDMLGSMATEAAIPGAGAVVDRHLRQGLGETRHRSADVGLRARGGLRRDAILRSHPGGRGGPALVARRALQPVGDQLHLGRDLRGRSLVLDRVQVRLSPEADRRVGGRSRRDFLRDRAPA